MVLVMVLVIVLVIVLVNGVKAGLS